MIAENKLTEYQIEFLKTLKYIRTEEQFRDLKKLLNLYFRKQLDIAIEEAKTSRDLTDEVYEEWLKNNSK